MDPQQLSLVSSNPEPVLDHEIEVVVPLAPPEVSPGVARAILNVIRSSNAPRTVAGGSQPSECRSEDVAS